MTDSRALPPPELAVQVQMVPAEEPSGEKHLAKAITQLLVLLTGSALVMLALGVLAHHNVPVPALGYIDTACVLLGVSSLGEIVSRTRWYS